MERDDQDALYRRAKERVEALKGFYVHLAVFLIINLGLFLLDLVTGGGASWFFWPLLGWGIGLAVHAFVVFGEEGRLGRAWEERKIKQLMDRDRGAGRA